MKKLCSVFAVACLGMLLNAPASAQDGTNLVKLFESGRGWNPHYLDSLFISPRARNDVNGDGRPDVTVLREDASGTPAEIVTFDVLDRKELWNLSLAEVAQALGTDQFRFRGFFSLSTNPDDVWAIFQDPNGGTVSGYYTILLERGQAPKHHNTDPFVLPAGRLALLDLNDDGAVELIIENRETGTVQVWGSSGTSTAVQDEIVAAMERLFQNYPNPFRDHTTIAYEVERPGPVTVTVYDLMGRRVRTLVDAMQPAGAYQVRWDGRDAAGQPVASGTYFYRLRVGNAVSSKQTLRIH